MEREHGTITGPDTGGPARGGPGDGEALAERPAGRPADHSGDHSADHGVARKRAIEAVGHVIRWSADGVTWHRLGVLPGVDPEAAAQYLRDVVPGASAQVRTVYRFTI